MNILRRFLSRIKGIAGVNQEKQEEIDFRLLSRVLSYKIKNEMIFHQALSHSSYIQLRDHNNLLSNERLEFLGDSVLNLVVGEYLYHKFPKSQEGELTKMRSRLVNRRALSIIAKEMGLLNFILISPGADQVPDRGLETILSDGFEAIVGAIYLDGGYDQVKYFLERSLFASMHRGMLKVEDENYKSQLLERAQAYGYSIPHYTIIDETGPDHDRTFTVEVFIENVSYGVGTGKNKKDAEQDAARKALDNFNPAENKNEKSA